MLEKIRDVFSGTHQEKKGEPPVNPSAKKEHDPIQCPHHFGYLANRAKDDPIPQECMICIEIVKCIEFNLM